MLWIHCKRLGRRDAEEGAVKQVAAGHEGAVALGVRLARIQRQAQSAVAICSLDLQTAHAKCDTRQTGE